VEGSLVTWIYHVAIADDWEAGLRIGSYEAATRGVLLEPGGHIRAVTADGVQQVLDDRYSDLTLPMLLVELYNGCTRRCGVPGRQGCWINRSADQWPSPLLECDDRLPGAATRAGGRPLARTSSLPPPRRWCCDGPLAGGLTRRSRTGG